MLSRDVFSHEIKNIFAGCNFNKYPVGVLKFLDYKTFVGAFLNTWHGIMAS